MRISFRRKARPTSAASAGPAEASEERDLAAVVACLEKDSEFQKGHPWKYRMARMLVATGKPRKMMERNRARVARQQA